MALNQSPMTPANQKPSAYQRYPLNMHRMEPGGAIKSRQALNEEDESAAIDAGWSTTAPRIPEPEQEKPTASIEERVAALEDWRASLSTHKGKK